MPLSLKVYILVLKGVHPSNCWECVLGITELRPPCWQSMNKHDFFVSKIYGLLIDIYKCYDVELNHRGKHAFKDCSNQYVDERFYDEFVFMSV